MNLEQQSILSFYEELTSLAEDSNVILVKHRETGELLVKKIKNVYNKEVYRCLQTHPVENIPKITECFEADDQLYVIEEYIHGKNLYSHFQERGPMDWQELAKVMILLCDILQELSCMDPPVVHRDLKPSNLILTPDGHIKLIDFNAAKLQNNEKMQDTVLMGTKNFAAPEQYGFGSSDNRTDIFGVGATMQYLLSGRFVNESITPSPLQMIIMKCCALSPEDRYQTAGELKEALLQLLRKKNYSTEKEKIQKEKSISQKFSWQLPGFRSRKIWKMILALLGYLLIIKICYSTTIRNEDIPVLGFKLRLEQTIYFIFFLSQVGLWFNYLGVQEKLPGINVKNKTFKDWIMLLVYSCAMFGVMLLIVIFLESIIY